MLSMGVNRPVNNSIQHAASGNHLLVFIFFKPFHVKVLFSAPRGSGYVPQSCCNQHQRRFPIREIAHHAGTPPDLTHDPFQRGACLKYCLTLLKKDSERVPAIVLIGDGLPVQGDTAGFYNFRENNRDILENAFRQA
jgi:hypothetical protein